MTNSSERKLLQPKKKKTIVDLFKLHKSTNRGSNGNKKEPYEKASSLIQELQTVMINIP
jgi:hypothetical protein